MSEEKGKNLFLEKLKSLREFQGLTESQASIIAGVDEVTYCEFENGEATPSEGQIARLCNYCSIHPDWLMLPKRSIEAFETEVYKAINKRRKRRVQYRGNKPKLLGKKLGVIRKAHHLTKQQMAQILRVNENVYNGYEWNSVVMAQVTFEICCEFFRVNFESLLNDNISVEIFSAEYLNKIDDPRRS